MPELVDVVFLECWRDRRAPDPADHRDYAPGDEGQVDAVTAGRLVRARHARFGRADSSSATSTTARELELEPSSGTSDATPRDRGRGKRDLELGKTRRVGRPHDTTPRAKDRRSR